MVNLGGKARSHGLGQGFQRGWGLIWQKEGDCSLSGLYKRSRDMRRDTLQSGTRLQRDGLVQENDFGGGETTKETLKVMELMKCKFCRIQNPEL